MIHGKQDTIVPWTHGKALYEACTSRKRLVAPNTMHHNTNLSTDVSFFVLPMLQFFGIPDYNFETLEVPAWVFDKRRSISFGVVDSKSAEPQSSGVQEAHRQFIQVHGDTLATQDGRVPMGFPVCVRHVARLPPMREHPPSTLLGGARRSASCPPPRQAVGAPELISLDDAASAHVLSKLLSKLSPDDIDEDIDDDVPVPPDDVGFFKVPVTRAGDQCLWNGSRNIIAGFCDGSSVARGQERRSHEPRRELPPPSNDLSM